MRFLNAGVFLPLAIVILESLSGAVPAVAADLEFEVASIKPSPPPDAPRTPMKIDRGRVVYNAFSPRMLIQIALRAPAWKITGGPSWLDSDRYDVAAILPSGATSDQIPAMVQRLLADRFHLRSRAETRQLDVYALRIAKNGPKLKPPDMGEQWSEGAMKGGIFAGSLELHQLNMDGLAEVLSSKTGRPVINRTQLNGLFDVRLKWAPDNASPGAAGSDGPSLYTALTEQLGLKLEPVKAPVEVMVITDIRKPSAN
ncbi:MAG TPA: TIGR03435 family protein [Bryobacteraceae bacterium]|nr:TIGR03435 family protein [Bryobacteraceae bacterium]